MKRSKKTLSMLLLIAVLVSMIVVPSSVGYAEEQNTNAVPDASLTYAEGGPAVEDPGYGMPSDLVRYVDAVNGNDNNDGKTQDAAWKTQKKVSDSIAELSEGTHILFKRGQSWDSELVLRAGKGSEGKRIVIGAYGNLSDARPKFTGTATQRGQVYLRQQSTYITIRDLDVEFIIIDEASNNILVFGNVVHWMTYLCQQQSHPLYGLPYADAGIYVLGLAHHVAIVDNFIYDINKNDAICIHDTGWGDNPVPVGDSVWVVDNVIIGSEGMEEGIDFATVAYEPRMPAKDVKIIGNSVQAQALSGFSTFTGSASGGIGVNHSGSYYRVIGNIVSGTKSNGMFYNSSHLKYSNHDAQISGNILFKNGDGWAKPSFAIGMNSANAKNNTILHTASGREALIISNAVAEEDGSVLYSGDNSITRNLIIGGNAVAKLVRLWDWNAAGIIGNPIRDMDYNWYSTPSAEPFLLGPRKGEIYKLASLDGWKEKTGFDMNSESGDVPSICFPEETAFNNDPRNWKKPEFLVHFIPDDSWKGNDFDGEPVGAFNSEGIRQGMEIEPMSGLDNGGYGWEGPQIIQQRYPLRISFTITSLLSELSQLQDKFVASGKLKGPLAAQLTNNLNQAIHQYEKGSLSKAANHLEDYIKHMNNEPLQENIAPKAKELLNKRANELLSRLK